MSATSHLHPRTAADVARERMDVAIESSIGGHPEYDEGTVFVPGDLPDVGAIVDRHVRQHRPVVIVYADGRTQPAPTRRRRRSPLSRLRSRRRVPAR